jgi:hypothetical protein
VLRGEKTRLTGFSDSLLVVGKEFSLESGDCKFHFAQYL